MIIKSKQEQKAIAADIFKRYPKAKSVSVTSDGMAFITDEGDNAVKNHARNNRYKRKLSITPFTRDDLVNDESGKAKTVKELLTEIESANVAGVVSDILETELNGEKRKTVLEAAAKRLSELNKAE